MAGRKTTTNSKKTTKSQEQERASSSQTVRERQYEEFQRRRQVNSVVLFAVGLLLLAFALFELGGAWAWFHSLIQTIFGLAMFAVGPALIFIAVKRKTPLVVIVLTLICAMLHIIGDYNGDLKITDIKNCDCGYGGIVGHITSMPFALFTQVGGAIIIVLLTFVLIMLTANITLDSFLKFAGKPIKKVGEYAEMQREFHEMDAARIAENREKIKTEELYTKMKAAEYSIDKEIGKDVKFASIMAVADAAAKDAQDEFEAEIRENIAEQFPDESETQDSSAAKTPPVYISPDGNAVNDSANNFDSNPDLNPDEPPFDIPDSISDSNAFEIAVDNFTQEEEERLRENREREEALRRAEQEQLEQQRQSDYDSVMAFAEAAEQYSLPSINLLDDIVKKRSDTDIQAELDANAEKLIETLKSFAVITKLVGVIRGPSVTRYEIQPAPGVKISKITNLTDDIALNLAAAGVRMEAPIPGKSAVGVEVPNHTVDTVTFRELIDSKEFREPGSNLRAVIGKAISGEIIISDISKMPHLLIAGTTGSGKSVCVNSIIMSILYRATPAEIRLIMIDPKMVEFAIYGGIPHLLTPVVTDPKKAAGALGWAVGEMTQRYTLFAENNVRNINEYNDLVKSNDNKNTDDDFIELAPMPKIVIFIDELADLMMTAAREVEGNICRLTQLARAAGIHLVIATQRPTVNVVTGLIKANIPSRIALKVASQVDSRTIIDTAGADKLIGNGDMLYVPTGSPKPVRVQGCYVSNKEIDRVVAFIKDSFDLDYDENVLEEIERQAQAVGEKEKGGDSLDEFDMDDDKLEDAIEAVIDAGKASTSYLQLKLKLGYGRAARMIDIMEKMGVVGKFEGSKPREVLMTRQDWLERKLNK